MKLANWAQGAAAGAIAGGFAGFILGELGAADILGFGRPSIATAGMLAGAVVGVVQRARIIVWLDVALALVYLVIISTPLMSVAASRWVRADAVPQASADAIVVLSGRVSADSGLDFGAVERLLTAIELYQRGVAPRLLTTRVEGSYGAEIISSTSEQRRLLRIGGALPAWTMLEGKVGTTRDEAVEVASTLLPGARTIVVVTSPMHTRRACATFEAVGFTVRCQPAREEQDITWRPIESSDRLASFRDYIYERLGMIKYQAKGWLPRKSP